VKLLPAPFNVILKATADWWDALFMLAGLSIVWLLSWFTIILGPPATLGIIYVGNQVAHGRGAALGDFVEGARRHFVRGWLWTILNLSVFMLISFNFWFYGQIELIWTVFLQIVLVVLVLLWLGAQIYILPFLLEQEKKQLRLAIKNGLLTSLASPGYTLIILVLTLVVGTASLVFIFPLLMGVPGLIAVLCNHAVLERLETFGLRESDDI
jgi:uncharacterized membrane protein YesL